jgi:hypothetical protein
MATASHTTAKFIKTAGLPVALWAFFMHPAFAQEYWAACGMPTLKQSAKAWTKGEVANLLAIAVPDDGPTDKKLAALTELADATEHNSPLPDGFEKAILSILARSEAQIAVPTARIVGNLRLESARGELESLAASANSGDGVAAMKALVSLGGEKSIEFLRKLYLQKCVPRVAHSSAEAIDETPLERTNIICALIDLDTELTVSDVLTHLSRFPGESYSKYVWEMLFSRTNGPSATIRALRGRNLPISAATVGIECASAKGKDAQLLIDAIQYAASPPAKRNNAETVPPNGP